MSTKLAALTILAIGAVGLTSARIRAADGGGAVGTTRPGPKIAFIRHDLSGTSHLFVMNPDGTELQQLTYGAADDSSQRWSPDGRQIVFERWVNASVDAPESNIFAIGADGTGLRQLTSDGGFELSPAWSPDGRTIAYGTEDGLFAMNTDGSAKRRLASTKRTPYSWAGDVSWSPDGRKIAYTSDGGIRVVTADGTGNHRLRGAGGDCPAWSPDGRRIAYVGGVPGNRYSRIYVVSARRPHARVRLLTRHAYTEGGGFAWSPNGRRIVYARERGRGVYLIDVNGTHDRRLTRNPLRRDLWAGGFSWSPDGVELAYASDRSGNGDIFVLNRSWRAQQQLTEGLEVDGAPRFSLWRRTESC